MLAVMKRSVYDALGDAELAWKCIEPVIERVRGKHLNVKREAYGQLNAGQRALLMYWILYGHAKNGTAQFFDEIDYLLGQAGFWGELKSGLNYFGQEAMIPVLEEMEEVYRILRARISPADVGFFSEKIKSNPGLLKTAGRIDASFRALAPETIKRVGAYIRENPGEFIQIKY